MPEIKQFSIGGIPLAGTEHVSLGSRHPSQAGVVALETSSENGLILDADLRAGFIHRAAEKLFEVRDYRAAIMLADRHDWWSSFSGELVVTQSIENAMGLAPPRKAAWLRALLAELTRIHSHLAYLSYIDDAVWDVVEKIRGLLVAWSGNRVHTMLNRVGGLGTDMPEDLSAPFAEVMDDAITLGGSLADRVPERFRGLGVADPSTCRAYALSGPVARACGIDLDLRRNNPVYEEIFVSARLHREGDAYARFMVLADEVVASARMTQRFLAEVPDGPVAVRLSRRLKVPEGEHVCELEAPWGLASALLVSRGGQTPWRLALRTPTFANVSALEKLLVGAEITQIPDIVASIGFAVGDLDK